MACERGHKEIVEILIDKGININEMGSLFGCNALNVTSENGHKEIVELLVAEGIDIK